MPQIVLKSSISCKNKHFQLFESKILAHVIIVGAMLSIKTIEILTHNNQSL